MDLITLDKIDRGKEYLVWMIEDNVPVRIYDFCIDIGQVVSLYHKQLFNDPIIINIQDRKIVIRKKEANQIKVKPING